MSDDEADPSLLDLLRQSLGLNLNSTQGPPETRVLESAQFIYDNAIDVSITADGTKAAARLIYDMMQQKAFSTDAWSEHELHPKTKDEATVDFIFTMDLLNFSFWSERSEADRFSVEYKDRKWTGNCIKAANGSAAALVNTLVDDFPCFRDETRFEGKTVRLYKRAQILVADTWACFNGTGFGEFHDIDKITMFADYRIPQMLNALGCLWFGPALESRIRQRKELRSGENCEIELRGCSIWCVELIRREILRAHPDAEVNAILIDFFLYDTVKEREAAGEMEEMIPHHRTILAIRMSNIEHSLNVILPTYNNDFPAELRNLSTALLAQSRSRAPALKPDEEIARPYACAEIACKRLKAKLRLPPLQSRPPCPPRVYKKLCTYLEQTLPAKLPVKRPAAAVVENDDSNSTVPSSSTNTPKKARIAKSTTTTPSKNRTATPTKPTPTKSPHKKVLFAGKLADRETHTSFESGEAPPHIMPFIRRLCSAFSTPPLAPHVYTGACIVLPLASLKQPTSIDDKPRFIRESTALTIALFFMVLAKMQVGSIDAETHLQRTQKAIALADLVQDGNLDSLDVDNWLTRIASEGWAMGMEWWANIPEDVIGEDELLSSTTANIPGNHIQDPDEDFETLGLSATDKKGKKKKFILDDEEDPEGVLLPGLGTMMQDRVDWLSEERRMEYLDWKDDILARIRQIENGTGKGRVVGA
ncbi:hypothetical protein UCRPC4_g01062 [Phaeomoniella chlamydospora]|uniref:Queuosine 5'-phosphate N-glycosylase/hydrolase n=1 Tax=Phaeomoniella chlamydospora TaxID=158046 RepID=A0A0G2EXY7_PHACM|nr:hypothetical protein UCRPC4_g01062 [Phaeomoniella chlamydospora]